MMASGATAPGGLLLMDAATGQAVDTLQLYMVSGDTGD